MQEIKRILVIDDNHSIHEDFKKIFNHGKKGNERLSSLEDELFESERQNSLALPLNFEMVSAFQGEQGVSLAHKARQEGNPFHVAFVDMRMPPGWDGLQTLKVLSKEDPEIQFVVCTAYSDSSLDDFLKINEAKDRLLFIKKPFDPMEVTLTAATLAEKWKLAQLAKAKMDQMEGIIKERTALLENSERLSALGEMAAGIAHEINNPLTIISANCAILQNLVKNNKLDAERVGKAALQMQETVLRISKIISGLRTFSRDASQDIPEQCNVHDIIKDTLELCHKKFEHSEIKIEVTEGANDFKVNVNKIQLSQVFLNLLVNAKDAIEGLAGEKWIRIETKEEGNKIKISFTDCGKGIPPSIREKIMNPFFTTKEVGKGTGLGLSISHGIIKRHGGSFSLDTDSPNTKFEILLPKP